MDLTNPQLPPQEQLKKSRKIYVRMVTFSMIVVIVVLRIFVFPKLLDLYREFNAPLPLTVQYGPGLGIVLALGFLFLSEKREDIRPQISERVWETLMMPILGLVVSLLIISTLTPIYSLTSLIK